MKYLEILFWKIAIWLIKKEWGADCLSKDTDDFPELGYPRCGSCRAKEIIDWIEYNIELLKL
jgi:hypothetical protein